MSGGKNSGGGAIKSGDAKITRTPAVKPEAPKMQVIRKAHSDVMARDSAFSNRTASATKARPDGQKKG